MKISIIVPILSPVNPFDEKLFLQSIQECSAQSYQDIEILVVTNLANLPKDRISNREIKYIDYQENDFGKLMAQAVSASQGDYLFFKSLSARIGEDLIEEMVEATENAHYPLIKVQVAHMEPNLNLQEKYVLSIPEVFDYLEMRSIFRDSLNQLWTGLYHRSLFQKVPYPQQVLSGYEEVAFKMLEAAQQVVFLQKSSYQAQEEVLNKNLFLLIESIQAFEKRKVDYQKAGLPYAIMDYRIFYLINELIKHPSFEQLDCTKQSYYRGKYVGLVLKL